MFWLVADVAIHERTGNRRGLQDALQAIARAGAGMASTWSAERLLATGDAATGTTALTELYQREKDRPAAPDLNGLCKDLGVRIADHAVHFDDSARWAAIRHAITRPN